MAFSVWFLFSVVLNLSHLSSFKSQQQSRAFTFTLTFPDSSSVPSDPPPSTGRPGSAAAGPHLLRRVRPAQRVQRACLGRPAEGVWGLEFLHGPGRRARLDRRLGGRRLRRSGVISEDESGGTGSGRGPPPWTAGSDCGGAWPPADDPADTGVKAGAPPQVE